MFNPLIEKELEEFLKLKITGAKTCACNLCSYDREMYRFMQEVLKDYTIENVAKAVERAKNLHTNNSERWPKELGSHVYLLVDEFFKLLKKSGQKAIAHLIFLLASSFIVATTIYVLPLPVLPLKYNPFSTFG